MWEYLDKTVVYHSEEWQALVAFRYGAYGWCTWSVDDGIATMKWTRF